MPGFGSCHAVSSDEQYRCELCGLIYREPVQNLETGKCFCKSCVEKKDDAVYHPPDNAVRREMKGLLVYCEMCGWKGSLELLERHFCLPKSSIDVRTENIVLRERLALAEKKICSLNKENIKLEEEIVKLKEEISVFKKDQYIIQDLEYDLPLADTVEIEKCPSVLEAQPSQEKQVQPVHGSSFAAIAGALEEKFLDLNEQQKKVEGALDDSTKDLMLHSKGVEALSHLIAVRNELGDAPKTGHGTVNSLSGNFSVFFSHPPNGSSMQCRWRIQDFSRALSDAQKQPHLHFESPIWTTCGYCVQALLYLNGYRESFGSHVSLFMKIVPGPDDDLLKWPINPMLTFCLLDLKGSNARPWIRNCRADPESPCFKRRPPSPHESSVSNIASGLQNFISIDKMKKEYVKNDTIKLDLRLLLK